MNALGAVIVNALEELLRVLFVPIRDLIRTHGNGLVDIIIGTPHPNSVFGAPSNGPWPKLYGYYWDGIMPLTLTLYGVSIGLVIFLESTSHVFGGYHRSKLKKRAFTGLLGILSWWWIAALSLRFVSALGGVLAPDLSDVTLFETLSFTTIGVLGTAISLGIDLALIALVGLIYLIRQFGLYMYVLLMPILFVLWIPAVGPFGLLAQFARRLAGFFLPLLFMTLPVAVLFRLSELLGQSVSLSMGGFGAWLFALVLPFIALFSPFVLFWQAGALFFMTDRTARRFSSGRAQNRAQQIQQSTQVAAHSGRNFGRGVAGKPAISRNNQQLLSSGNSRSHAAGSRLRSSQSTLREMFSERMQGVGSTGQDDTPGTGQTESSAIKQQTLSDTEATDERDADFDALRERTDSTDATEDSGTDSDDRPWYIN